MLSCREDSVVKGRYVKGLLLNAGITLNPFQSFGVPTIQYQNLSNFLGGKGYMYLNNPHYWTPSRRTPWTCVKGGLIDWYMDVKSTVPIPEHKQQSILLGTFYSQGGRDGFSIFLIWLTIQIPDCNDWFLPGETWAECGNIPAAHGTKERTLLVKSSWMVYIRLVSLILSSDVFHSNKT